MTVVQNMQITQDGTYLFYKEDGKQKHRLFDNENDARDFADVLKKECEKYEC